MGSQVPGFPKNLPPKKFFKKNQKSRNFPKSRFSQVQNYKFQSPKKHRFYSIVILILVRGPLDLLGGSKFKKKKITQKYPQEKKFFFTNQFETIYYLQFFQKPFLKTWTTKHSPFSTKTWENFSP